MIVPSMNSEELLVEIFKDLEVVNRKADYLTQSLRRKAIKSKEKYVQRIFDYKSMRHNQWFIVAEHFVKHYRFVRAVYYNNRLGLNGITVDGDNLTMNHFSTHFLDRYNERFLESKGASHLELLKRFVLSNSVHSIRSSQGIRSNEQQIFVKLKEGVGLGYKEFLQGRCVMFHFKTFISNEMLLNHQIEDYTTLSKRYDYFEEECLRGKKCA